ncbi:hypothetical protein K438DRAFT_41139 [Mycena galopus ATCC 62051]|nr:hypothetical protein K438DRAFT_41139 [Mycena galopus ATCC 62051]
MSRLYCASLQPPQTLQWAVTVHKSRGLTLQKVKLGLGKNGFPTDLTFIALSRVKRLTRS